MTNWKTTVSGILAAVTSVLTLVAMLPAQLGDISTLIPEAYKSRIVMAGLFATFALRVIKSLSTQDAAAPPTAIVPPLYAPGPIGPDAQTGEAK